MIHLRLACERCVALALTIAAAACFENPGGPALPPPAVVATNATRAATVGVPFDYDATQAGATFADLDARLTYTISFANHARGLTADAGSVTGTPTSPGVVNVRIDAEDAYGRTARDTFSVVVFAAGLTTPTLPGTMYAYTDATLPLHYTGAGGGMAQIDNTPIDNPITDAGATLGRVLFYDKRMSVNDGVACASCHLQEFGFSDTAVKSRGFAGGFTGRHSMALANARYYDRGRFFWDERAATLEAQALMPIADPVEMGMQLENLVTKLKVTPYYANLFTAAFGDAAVTTDRISRALAQFVRSMVPVASPFDAAYNGGETLVPTLLTQEQQDGLAVFQGSSCSSCHMGSGFANNAPVNTGLDATVTDAGAGDGKFKAPSLRNITVRAPYMHDGRFATLMEVIDFYNSGVVQNPFLDDILRVSPGGAPRQLNLTPADKAALIAFLEALTDNAFLTAPRFSNPFTP